LTDAKKSFKKALDIKPGYEDAWKALKELEG
jgi:Tfp pilus assembly protein PilF